MTRSRVARWTPGFVPSLRLVLRPALAYLVFTATGFMALMGCAAWYERGRDLVEMFFATIAGLIGVLLGQLIAVLRFRAAPVFIAGAISTVTGAYLLAMTSLPSIIPSQLVPAVIFFFFAFPCGLLSLQHRWELLASFWPAVGWIGSVFYILNKEGRVSEWEEDKVSAWLPVPLVMLAFFLVLWLVYLASKQAMRVELWQSLSGAAARRIAKKATVTALPRKNLLPILVVAAALFAITAVLAPFLWRTGKGDREGGKVRVDDTEQAEEPRRGPKIDGDVIAEQLRQLAQAAKKTGLKLWPLLFLLLLYRPAKRALLTTHLLTPIVPTPPTERIDNLWEYVRIAAEDAGVVPSPSDSVEQLLARIQEKGLGGPAVARAAEIYARTRYGFTVARGDALAMRPQAIEAGRELRARLTTWDRVRNLWRPLA